MTNIIIKFIFVFFFKKLVLIRQFKLQQIIDYINLKMENDIQIGKDFINSLKNLILICDKPNKPISDENFDRILLALNKQLPF